ncbi:phage holin family protein [Tistrella bauzanensis]|uniref:phage holin family protein n=1 Tax=Tistrella TaxID=171436 RepID=UPI0031F6595D
MDIVSTIQQMLTDLWAWLRQVMDLLGVTMVLAYLGRLAWHADQVQRGRRRFFSKHLWWELVAAVAIGIVADGAVAYAGLTGAPRTAAIVTIAYLGPRGLEHLMGRLIDARRGPSA